MMIKINRTRLFKINPSYKVNKIHFDVGLILEIVSRSCRIIETAVSYCIHNNSLSRKSVYLDTLLDFV
jgi:hypothetical protein